MKISKWLIGIIVIVLAVIISLLVIFFGNLEKSPSDDNQPTTASTEPTSAPVTDPTDSGSDDIHNDDTQIPDDDAPTTPGGTITIPNQEPTEGPSIEPGDQPSDEPTNAPTEAPANDPTEPDEPTTPQPTEPENNGPDLSMTYEEFQNLPPAKMREFQESFADIEDFFEWYNAAKEAYEKANPPIDAGDGTITLPTD